MINEYDCTNAIFEFQHWNHIFQRWYHDSRGISSLRKQEYGNGEWVRPLSSATFDSRCHRIIALPKLCLSRKLVTSNIDRGALWNRLWSDPTPANEISINFSTQNQRWFSQKTQTQFSPLNQIGISIISLAKLANKKVQSEDDYDYLISASIMTRIKSDVSIKKMAHAIQTSNPLF